MDLSELGPHLLVPMNARRLEKASVLWLNRRWLLEGGADPDDPCTSDAIKRWLLDSFAVTGPTFLEPEELLRGEAVTISCDRYGTPRGSMHGGSGRVGGVHGFQAKGIGRTPLAARETDRYHANGSLWLEAAVREAIFAEIVTAEFPHGAVPVVAILDTGRPLRWPGGERGPFRAILVRPAAPRLAHLQRSIFFGEGGRSGSEQHLDALRVRDAWRWLDRGGGRETLVKCFRLVGEQYGCGHAMRLWPGPFYSSNVAIDGRLLDFDSTRSMPDWRPTRGTVREAGFRNEGAFVREAARSLDALSRRHSARPIEAEALTQAFEAGHRHGLEQACARLAPSDEDARRMVARYFGSDAGRPPPVAGDHLFPSADRPSMEYERLVADAMATTKDLEPGDRRNGAVVSAFIRSRVSSGRRSWRGLPSDFRPRRQAGDVDWTWLEGKDGHGRNTTAIQGVAIRGRMKVAGQEVVLPVDDGAPDGWRTLLVRPDEKDHAARTGQAGMPADAPPDEAFHPVP